MLVNVGLCNRIPGQFPNCNFHGNITILVTFLNSWKKQEFVPQVLNQVVSLFCLFFFEAKPHGIIYGDE